MTSAGSAGPTESGPDAPTGVCRVLPSCDGLGHLTLDNASAPAGAPTGAWLPNAVALTSCPDRPAQVELLPSRLQIHRCANLSAKIHAHIMRPDEYSAASTRGENGPAGVALLLDLHSLACHGNSCNTVSHVRDVK